MLPSSPLTVLCIDDDVENTELRRQLLEGLGFSVLTANTGPDGLALITTQAPDIVLLDYRMPAMDGGQVAERAKKLRPGLPIVMLSAHVEVPREALEHVDCFIVKGEPVELLFGRMRQLMVPPERSARVWRDGTRRTG
jgi:CheY-like chemotaxis protein